MDYPRELLRRVRAVRRWRRWRLIWVTPRLCLLRITRHEKRESFDFGGSSCAATRPARSDELCRCRLARSHLPLIGASKDIRRMEAHGVGAYCRRHRLVRRAFHIPDTDRDKVVVLELTASIKTAKCGSTVSISAPSIRLRSFCYELSASEFGGENVIGCVWTTPTRPTAGWYSARHLRHTWC